MIKPERPHILMPFSPTVQKTGPCLRFPGGRGFVFSCLPSPVSEGETPTGLGEGEDAHPP